MSVIIFEIGSLSSWFAAVGTIAAVVCSIYLANQNNQIKLEVDILNDRLRHIMNGEDQYKREICITNVGLRTAHIRSISSCERKWFKMRHVSTATSSEEPLLASITQGQMFKYNVSFFGINLNTDKKYYICVTELSGKKYYKKLTP